jgi:hypothetical protein
VDASSFVCVVVLSLYLTLNFVISSLIVVIFKSVCIISLGAPIPVAARSTAARLLRSWVRIPPGAWMFVCCVLSGRGLCDELITRPEEYYLLWRIVVCDQETS